MCGLIGIISEEPVVEWIYQSLIHLQHRGQDAAGIFAYDPRTEKEKLHKNRGLVSQVFNASTLPLPDAPWGIGHIRYSTIGTGRVEDTHPLTVKHGSGTLALAHNGNIVNYVPLKAELEDDNVVFETTCDAEAILNMLAQHLSTDDDFSFEDVCHAVGKVLHNVAGAYSCVALRTGKGLIAFRDPWGFRPLLYGIHPDGHTHAFASENGPLKFLGFENIHDVQPGEVVYIDDEKRVYRKKLTAKRHAHCSFEYNYFAKPNTIIEEREVYRIRARLGQELAEKVREQNIEADVVIPVPDSARPSAIALAQHLGIPLEEGFVKQNHVGRTFIMPTQYARKKAMSQKLITVPSVFEGKRVILVDDSIVRGTVSTRVVELARRAGAKEIAFASTYPPIRHPCIYGIDFPRSEQLVAYGRDLEEIAEEIGVDRLVYNDIEGLKRAIDLDDICAACLTGVYPTSTYGVEELQDLRHSDITELELVCKS
ncbi:MAG: amidophosphoribosyltransferase [Chlamydiales bacterium]|nr:amidophosphoribosyltransferase [Chlamydiia bacterium]MCP5508485.1 amidophosphoribosyltransferase [Chlamydiales bacterium]